MPRKEQGGGQGGRGGSDILGILLLCLACLLFASLFSFDKFDLASVRNPPNRPAANWIGSFGANLGDYLFFWLGAGTYLLPMLLLGFSLAQFLPVLGYLRRRWPWALLLVVTCSGALDLGTDTLALDKLARAVPAPEAGWLERLSLNINAPGAGGVLGLNLNRYVLGYFGGIGSGIIYFTFYLIGLYGLTNFHLGDWFRAVWQRFLLWWAERGQSEHAIARKARKLERQAAKLKRQLSGGRPAAPEPDVREPVEEPVAADLSAALNLPEPTVRDLSQPQVKDSNRSPDEASRKRGRRPIEPPDDEPAEVIPAEEIVAAATTEEILGRKPDEDDDEDSADAAKSPPADDEIDPVKVAAQVRAKAGKGARRKAVRVAAPPVIGDYKVPGVRLLSLPEIKARPTDSKEELMRNAHIIRQTLAQFGIEVAQGDITKGPTITRYELHPAPGVKLEKITSLTNNITAALKAERIHVLAPVPGKSSVGVEVPNAIKSKVILRELLESDEWIHSKAKIPLALGKDVYGHPIVADLSDMPHMLIAGSTGSGKSVCINSIVASLLYRFSPEELRFVMIDPKVVELQQYNKLPHLVVPVVTDPKKVILALRWVVSEMEKRYQIFAKVGVRNINSFNTRPAKLPPKPVQSELPLNQRKDGEAGDGFAVEVDEEIVVPREDDIVIPEKLSYIVVIIDELADLMLVAPADVEMAIARITQMARAAGIHCIVATQRPSVDVITGVIKANIPARIAFQVASKVDSRTILDAMGAEKLLGKGDMLFLPPGSAKLFRAQGAFVTDEEIQKVVDFIAGQGKPSYEMEIHQQLAKPSSSGDENEGSGEDEELIEKCIDVIRSEAKASVSLLQRRLRLGYTRAARIMDDLESRGIVGPSKGAEPRDILIDLDAMPDEEEEE